MSTWSVGDCSIVRVPDDEFELLLPLDQATRDVLQPAAEWLVPSFVTEAWALRIGSSAIAILSGGKRILVDPWLAFDPPDRRHEEAAKRTDRLLSVLAAIGLSPPEVDIVINSHVDGVGLNTTFAGGLEEATFPRARYVLAKEEIEAVSAGGGPASEAWRVLLAGERVDLAADGRHLTDEVSLEWTGGHGSGHVVVHVDSGGQHAVIGGHLFLHPAQVFAPAPRPGQDLYPAAAADARRRLLDYCAGAGALLIGPLFAAPGGGRVVADEDRFRLDLS